MKRLIWFIGLLLYTEMVSAQTVRERLLHALELLQADPQMKHAILGISVVKTETNEKIVEINAETGLAPASCQKIITSATAMELLGPAYRYSTVLGYDGSISQGALNGNLYIIGSGDPSLGSWRYDSAKEVFVLNNWVTALKQQGIRSINGNLIACTGKWEPELLPGGWIWDDIGNYYGAGTTALNWRENQYDLFLRSGPFIGDKVEITGTTPELYGIELKSRLTAAAKGSGDNAYIYLPPNATKGYVKGTIPAGENSFTISGSFPDPAFQLLNVLKEKLDSLKIPPMDLRTVSQMPLPAHTVVYTHYSPSLDSLNYWFMKRSINLYGEAFAKTIAFEKAGTGSTEKGVALIKQFWKERGIDPASLHMLDGSGLSPQNRVTAAALVSVLQYARTRPWFRFYYDALPVFNNMKLKSGTIGGAKSFAGYHTAKDGTAYTVAIIVNNFDGSAGEIVSKMYSVLDELK